ncbi:MAG: HAD family hydrolase, partial [Duncaniella sp.]|nr:HAD family hydrolase [Duncaniella sp.]
ELLPMMLAAPTTAEAFDLVTATRPEVSIADVITLYRNHRPSIRLPWQSLYTLALLRNTGERIGIITDGRSLTQRNKIEALGLDRFVSPEHIIISEEIGGDKTTSLPFETIASMVTDEKLTYVGDNPAKDFACPASMGWHTACLLNAGRNIHPQNLSMLPPSTITIRSLTELPDLH